MKLKETERFLSNGIKMSKLIHAGTYGFFFSSPATYEYKTVFDLEKAMNLHGEGWQFEEFQSLFAGLALNLWRDLKDAPEQKDPVPLKEKEDKGI